MPRRRLPGATRIPDSPTREMGPNMADLDVADRFAVVRPRRENFTNVRLLRAFEVSLELSAGQRVAEERRAPLHEVGLSSHPREQSIEVLDAEANEVDTDRRCGVSRHREILVQALAAINQQLRRGCLHLAVRPEGANHQWRRVPPG